MSQDTDAKSPSGAAEISAAPASEASSTSSEQQISLAAERPPMPQPRARERSGETHRDAARSIEMPKPVEAVLKAVEAMKPAEAARPGRAVGGSGGSAGAAGRCKAEPTTRAPTALPCSRLRWLSPARVGAMAGALGTSVFARPVRRRETPMAAIDLTAVRTRSRACGRKWLRSSRASTAATATPMRSSPSSWSASSASTARRRRPRSQQRSAQAPSAGRPGRSSRSRPLLTAAPRRGDRFPSRRARRASRRLGGAPCQPRRRRHPGPPHRRVRGRSRRCRARRRPHRIRSAVRTAAGSCSPRTA